MADTHDTIKGLLAEFRGYSAGMPASYHVTMSWAGFRKMLDRFDAAHRREVATTKESLAVGNSGDCAKLREAVGYILKYADSVACRDHDEHTRHYIDQIRKWAQSALAAPPRNCDKYATADEALKAQEQMFNDSNFANGECKLGCPECDNPRVGCKIAWLYAPTTEQEGGNDGR